MLITSVSNDRIKEVKKIVKSSARRRERGVYAVEGIRMVREIPESHMEELYVAESCVEKYGEIIQKYKMIEPVIVRDSIFSAMSDTGTPQGILALVRTNQADISELCVGDTPPFILILDRLQDPGNLGTIIRTAEGAGATGIMLGNDTVDIYNPKTVRATMGSVFRMKLYISANLEADIMYLKKRGIVIYGAHLNGSTFYDVCYQGPCGFLIGNEGNGLSAQVSRTADKLIKIPMCGEVESLNAAVSTAVIAYEVLRQRNLKNSCHKP